MNEYFPPLIALFAAAFITYMWSIRGFFSAFLHMMCVIVAGAIAFGLWEPIAYWILEASPRSGAGAAIGASAWGLALALPFAVCVLVLRVIVDKIIPQNAQTGVTMDYIGGFACGLVAAVISTGIMVMSLQYLRMKHESWATYAAINYTQQGTARGSLEKNSGLVRPWVDELTADFYTYLSRGVFRTPTPLAALQPDVHLVSSGMRLNFGTTGLGESRNTIAPDAFELIKTYTVGDTAAGEPVNRTGVTVDRQKPGVPQGYVDLSGDSITRGYLAGYVVNFKAGAKEKSGQIVIGNGQVALVVASDEGDDWKTLFPMAVISQAESTSTRLGRWRFDADNTFIASVGGASQAPFAFEFLVPAGYQPTYFYVKNVRSDVRAEADQAFATTQERDRAIMSGRIVEAGGGGQQLEIDRSEARVVDASEDAARELGVLVRNGIGRTIQRGNHRSLNIEEHGRGYWLVNGEEVFSKAEISRRIVERSLRVDSLAVTESTVVVKVDVSMGMPASLLEQASATADPTEPPILVDSLGQRIQAVGFIYEDNEQFHIRYTPGRPLQAVNEAPALSSSRPSQTMEFIFRCNYGTEIVAYLIGDKEILRFDPPIKLDTRQN